MAIAKREDAQDSLGREAFITLFVVGNRFEEQLDLSCRNHGISHQQYAVLWVLCLSDHPLGVAMGTLADGLLHRAADATRVVDKLTNAGLVERLSSDVDRRVVLVRPTPSGREVFAKATADVKALHRSQFSSLSDLERAQLARLLNTAFWSKAPEADLK
jgi:DNA-binding MarR family transcriptional regulator